MIKEYPELTKLFPAIDGIATKSSNYERDDVKWVTPPYCEIRSDVLEILQMPDSTFIPWYDEKMKAITALIYLFVAVGDVPHLGYGSEEQKLTFGTGFTLLRDQIKLLHEAKKHLELIAKIRKDDFST